MLTLMLLGLLSGGLVGCHDDSDNADNNGGVDLGNGNEQIGTLYTPGELEPLMTQSITSSGSSLILSGTGTVLDSSTIDIPKLAVADDEVVSLFYDETGAFEFTQGTKITQTSPVFTLKLEQGEKFRRPILITLPYVESEKTPVPLVVNSDGTLSIVDIIKRDHTTQTITFQTSTPGSWVMLEFDLRGSNKVFDTGFRPKVDGFYIQNSGSDYYGGECFGMAIFSQWYYVEMKNKDGNFYPRFMDVIGSDSKGGDITTQDVIATRSFSAANQAQAHSYIPADSARERYETVIAFLQATGRPVGIGLSIGGWNVPDGGSHLHEVLAYRSNSSGKIFVYDPNVPYASGEEYNSTLNLVDDEYSAEEMSALKYNSVEDTFTFDEYENFDIDPNAKLYFDHVLANVKHGEYGQYSESFENIYDDALHQFSKNNQPEIVVTSHTEGESVSSRRVVLQGFVESSEVLVRGLAIQVNNQFYRTKVKLDESGEFLAIVKLHPGDNIIHFTTYDLDEKSKFNGEHEVTPNNYDISPFHLIWDKDEGIDNSILLMCGGVNDTNQENAKGDCLKVATDNEGNWFTSSPSSIVMNSLDYTADNSENNTGDTYSGMTNETGRWGPEGSGFATFRQDGQNSGQFARWCQKLASLNFAGRNDWHRPTKDELEGLYAFSSASMGLWGGRGWPTTEPYWSLTPTMWDGEFYAVDFTYGWLPGYSENRSFYGSCTSNER